MHRERSVYFLKLAQKLCVFVEWTAGFGDSHWLNARWQLMVGCLVNCVHE